MSADDILYHVTSRDIHGGCVLGWIYAFSTFHPTTHRSSLAILFLSIFRTTMSAMEVEPVLNTNLDAARTLQNSLNDAPLRIVADRDKFNTHRLEGAEDWEGASADDSLKDPAVVANDVAAQIVSLPWRHAVH
jgi:hypothetical protein